MSVRIAFDLPEEVFSAVRSTPEEFGRRLRIAAAVKWYEVGQLSQGKAAELAGVSRQEFLRSLSEFGVSPFQVTPEELARECRR